MYGKRIKNICIQFPMGQVVVGAVVSDGENLLKLSLSEYENGVHNFQYCGPYDNNSSYTILEQPEICATFQIYQDKLKCDTPIDPKWISELQSMGYNMDKLIYEIIE